MKYTESLRGFNLAVEVRFVRAVIRLAYATVVCGFNLAVEVRFVRAEEDEDIWYEFNQFQSRGRG